MIYYEYEMKYIAGNKVHISFDIRYNNQIRNTNGGISMTKEEKETKLYMKKLTLKAWTMILHKQGKISLAKCNKMISMIEQLAA